MSGRGKVGLVLSGGGARAAYQAGVLLAISRLLPEPERNPFPIICGTSAGAINAVALAAGATNYRQSVRFLAQMWKQLHISNVYDASLTYFLKTFFHFGISIATGGHGWRNPKSFLDNAPLRDFLARTMPLDGIQHSVEQGALQALALTASCFSTGMSVTFFEGLAGIEEWTRHQRIGVRERISLDHLMATSAIPLIFPAAQIGKLHYCDGAIRQMTPLSPALHLGAEKLFIVGLASQRPDGVERRAAGYAPTPAQIFGHLLNSVFIDSMSMDMERLLRVNHTVSLLDGYQELCAQTNLKQVEVFMLSPSKSLESIAYQYAHEFPPVLRFLMKGAGGTRQRGMTLATYLLFEPGYCRALIALGYKDALNQKEAIKQFLEL
ncbi:MAG: patatin-like phospholipase family protein [Aquitalea sp.]|nr:patatin-like phospholipase family protein [Aquitalea sp.]